ncbi:RNA polymerase sigma factor, sigma-70 family [Massilia yuzhufengensis]|uniref:RNA polymerase sigma factor, sigma-70 family n=1 Tax=Massilia yuzhufengensis TaxID=1164594 RepID=A0A1I1NKT8_9BURK|nr:RNA polymerase sigma factor, sigma-70 family [Massilia yuzhufengensis]
MDAQVERSIAAVWRIESAKIVATVARMVRDVGLAEELAQDALVAALEHWPRDGIPDNPAAWLVTTAKHAALDRLRRDRVLQQKLVQIGLDLEAQEALIVPDFVDSLDAARNDVFQDDLLRLMFTACHPVLSLDARLALTLKLLGGLSTQEIARAFLVPEATMAQRIVRAKRTLGEARVPFELPPPQELGERLGAVLEAVYLVFNEGYTATAGDDWMRPALVDEALRLGRMLAQLAPNEPEALGLVALMELQASRMGARTDPEGRPVLLLDQDRARWDGVLLRRGLSALARAEALALPRSSYLLQAAIAACHARAHGCGNGLARHRHAVRRTGGGVAFTGGGTQSRGGGGHGRRPRGRAGAGRPAGAGRQAAGLPLAAQRARRPAGQAGAARRSAPRIRTRRRHDRQRPRTRTAAGTGARPALMRTACRVQAGLSGRCNPPCPAVPRGPGWPAGRPG